MSDPGLHDRPVLVIDPDMHTAPIRRADADRAGRFAVTATEDKTVRVWSLLDGGLLRTIRLPAGHGKVGKAYAVAISPDGGTIAAGGWTRQPNWPDPNEQIYLFDRESGAMTQRIDALPNVVNDLAFSDDGGRLAAVLFGGRGLRLYARDAAGSLRQLAADSDYGDSSYGVAFAADGRLATTSYDGRLRLYDDAGRRLLPPVATPHAEPFGLAFNPADGRLAVGFYDSTEVLLYDGSTLAPLPSPDVGIDNGNLGSVAWSADGATLYAAGRYWDGTGFPVAAWDGGAGPRRVLPAGDNTAMSLRPLPDGALLVAAAGPWLGLLAADGAARWTQAPKQIDPRCQMSNLAVSPDGMLVEFGPKQWGVEDRLRFDVAALRLMPAPDDGRAAPPVQDTLAVEGWEDSTAPTLDRALLPLEPYEIARSLAIAPAGGRFLLGADWTLQAFDKTGTALWQRPVPGTAWAVNVAGDGRLAVAAYGDGTLRWHRMDDGAELLALFTLPDGENWVTWTPEGVYAASPGARSVLRWHVNHGWDAAATSVPVSAIPETHRPEVIPLVLPNLGTPGAIAAAELAKIRAAVQRETGSDSEPGTRLHLLAIGISDYGTDSGHLDLAYADQDASDVAAALVRSQTGLYAAVMPSVLVNGEATKAAIFDEFAALGEAMGKGGGGDTAVILFSGHGEMAGDKFYLLPHGVDARSPGAIKASAMPITEFHDEIAAIAQHGRVLVFLDACRSGGATLPADRSLRALLAAPNVSVFTSSSAGENSLEHADWQNGAFTEALLEALRRDPDGDSLVRISDIAAHLSDRVPALTGGRQHPEVELHLEARVFSVTG